MSTNSIVSAANELSVGRQYLSFLEEQKEAFANTKNSDRAAEFKTAMVCLDTLLNKELISLYNKDRIEQWKKTRQTYTDKINSIADIKSVGNVVSGLVYYSEEVNRFYNHIEKNKAYLASQTAQRELKHIAVFYPKDSFSSHTSNGLITLLATLDSLLEFTELQNLQGFKQPADKKKLADFKEYILGCERQILQEIKQRLENSTENASLHPFINFIDKATKVGNGLKKGNYYPDLIATEERSLKVKADLLDVFLAYPRRQENLLATRAKELLDIEKIVGTKVENQQFTLPAQTEKNYSYQKQRYELQCAIAPRLMKCQAILQQMAELNTNLAEANISVSKKQYLQINQRLLYQEAELNLGNVHGLVEKTRKSSVLKALFLGNKTKKFLKDVEQACIDMGKELKNQLGNEALVETNDYLQGQAINTEVIELKGHWLQVRHEIKHYAGSLSNKVNQYLIESSKKANWQKYNAGLLAIKDALNYSSYLVSSDLDLISGETKLKADLINFNPFDPLNVTHEVTDHDQHYLGDFSSLNNEQIKHLLMNVSQMREALISQKTILRSNFEKFSPLQKWWYGSLYVTEKKDLDKQLTLVVKPLENKLNSEIFRRLKANLRYGQLDQEIQAQWEQTLTKSSGFFCYNLAEDQANTILAELKLEEIKLKTAINKWFTALRGIDLTAEKRKLANLKDLQRSIIYQREKQIQPVQLTIDNEFARQFIAGLNSAGKLGVLQSSWLENLVQRKEVKMYETQPNELKAIMHKLITITAEQPEVFSEFYESFKTYLIENGFSDFKFANEALTLEGLVNGLFLENYNADMRAAFATWLARHRQDLIELKASRQMEQPETIKNFISDLLSVIPKQTVSYSTALKDLINAYNDFSYVKSKTLTKVSNIEEWMQWVKNDHSESSHCNKTELFLAKLEKDLKKNPNNDMLLFKISYLKQMLDQVGKDNHLLEQSFDSAVNPLKEKYQEEIDNTLNVIQEIIYQRADNGYYFNWLLAATRSELNRVHNVQGQSTAFMPTKANKAANPLTYKKALEVMLAILQGNKASLTPAEKEMLEALEDIDKRVKTANITSIYVGLLKKCETHLNSMIIEPSYTVEFRTQLANFASLVAQYKSSVNKNDQGDLTKNIQGAGNAIGQLLTKPHDLKLESLDIKPGQLKSPGSIVGINEVWRAVLLVQLSETTWCTTQDRLKVYVDSYQGNKLDLCALMVSFCNKGEINWQPGNKAIIFSYADKYFDRLFATGRDDLAASSGDFYFDFSKLKYLLEQVPELNDSFNQKLANWIKTENRSWFEKNQALLTKLPASLENRIAYANIGVRELLASIPAFNANPVIKRAYIGKMNGFFARVLGEGETARWYPSYSELDAQSKQQFDTILQAYLADEFKASSGLPIGNPYDDKLVAKICGHEAFYLREIRLKSLGRLLTDAVKQTNDGQNFLQDNHEILKRFRDRLTTFDKHEPITLLPNPPSVEDEAALAKLLNDTLKDAPWRKVVDEILAGKLLEEKNISPFIKLDYLSHYRLQHIQYLLQMSELTLEQLQEFCDYVKDRSYFTDSDFSRLQDELVEALSQQGWTEGLAKLVSQFGDDVTQEFCLAKCFAKALKDEDTALVQNLLQAKATELFKTSVGQFAIIKEMELYRAACVEKADLTQAQTCYSLATQQILQVIDAGYSVYKNTDVSYSITYGQLSLEHAIAGLMQLGFANSSQTSEQANLALKTYLAELSDEVSGKLQAESKSWFADYSLDQLVSLQREQLIETLGQWNANLFALAERFASPLVYDDFILTHAQQLLTLTMSEVQAFAKLLPSAKNKANDIFGQFRTQIGIGNFAKLLDKKLAEWYKSGSTNISAAYNRLSDLIQLHTAHPDMNDELLKQSMVLLLNGLKEQHSQLESEFLAGLNLAYQQWQVKGSEAVAYMPHREFLTQSFEELFRGANGEAQATLEQTTRVFRQYRLLHILQQGKDIITTDVGEELEDIIQQLGNQRASVDSFVTWYVPNSEETKAYGLLLAKNAKQINAVMLELLTKWAKKPCAEDDIRYRLVQNILSANYLQLLQEQESELALELSSKFNKVNEQIKEAKAEKVLGKNLLTNLHHAKGAEQFIKLCQREFIETLDDDISSQAFSRLLDAFAGLIRVSMPGCEALANDPFYAVLQDEVQSIPRDLLEDTTKLQALKDGLENIGTKLYEKLKPIENKADRLKTMSQVIAELIQIEAEIAKLEDGLKLDSESNKALAENGVYENYNESKLNVKRLTDLEKNFSSKYQQLAKQCKLYGINGKLDLTDMQQIIEAKHRAQQQSLAEYKKLHERVISLYQALQSVEMAVPVFNEWRDKQPSDVLLLNYDQLTGLVMILDEVRFEALKTALSELVQNELKVTEPIRALYGAALKLIDAARVSNAVSNTDKREYVNQYKQVADLHAIYQDLQGRIGDFPRKVADTNYQDNWLDDSVQLILVMQRELKELKDYLTSDQQVGIFKTLLSLRSELDNKELELKQQVKEFAAQSQSPSHGGSVRGILKFLISPQKTSTTPSLESKSKFGGSYSPQADMTPDEEDGLAKKFDSMNFIDDYCDSNEATDEEAYEENSFKPN